MLPSLGTTDRASISDVTGLDGAAVAERRGRVGGESCCSSREGQRSPKVERPNLSMVFFLFVAAAREVSLIYYVKYSIFTQYLPTGLLRPPLSIP
jgi:hypothetical protein